MQDTFVREKRAVDSGINGNIAVEYKEKQQGHSKKAYGIVKRLCDIMLSITALIVLIPLLLIVALIIYIDDPKGSPIFSQTRVGKNGKEFKFFKFRSMYCNAEERFEELLAQNEMDGPAFKIKDDPRITRVGKFIRKTSIDELPQLLNIFWGSMSVVGPRPPLPREVEQYSDYEKRRLEVTPGLTCYWQIQPKRNNVSFEEWMRMDIKYIEERSLWVDIKIILGTVKAVIFRYGV